MSKPFRIREQEEALYRMAESTVEHNQDNSVREKELEDALVSLLPDIDQEKAKRKRAKEIIDSLTRPGGTKPDDEFQLALALDAYDYEPMRLVRDDDGKLVENRFSTPHFKLAEKKRARAEANKMHTWAGRKETEYEALSQWAIDQALKGRPALDLTWENCIKESGYLKAKTGAP